ncbi:hypothetical protein G8O24_30570 [Bradyrhizobium sp. INPA01-394B]|uniref:Glycosyltransferase RgtA/B/C/D-like domain-containing protein n=1 Tax=Bradyrhizobium campsiandrae TaxID=1729892 RepID=A0ABR7U626_9BRAD|nr:hypothetical protein [Bradyrhizobium campsiandrae]MBC9881676.1 hypothetical protein [Bradyrhizobium campsiandrae]MBC9979479.1 hypothetical protein [Bradyrhizobium campsiandrae]
MPSLYLAATLLYSVKQAVWGVQVDPESAYTMNGLAAAAGYGSLKFDHPGTTTTLLVELVIRSWSLVARTEDVVAFGLQHYDAITWAARTCEALVLTGALLAGGLIVGRTTQSAVAAMLFQAGAFVHSDAFHYQTVLAPESLMAAIALFGMAIVIKAALDTHPPTAGLGVLSGAMFALGFSTKYLYLPQALFAVCLLRNRRALVAAMIAGTIGFIGFNLIFNPGTITRGFGWLVQIATHKGYYGEGEAGFIDFGTFWSNMGEITASASVVAGIYVAAAGTALAWCVRSRSWRDPVSLTLGAAALIYAAHLVATSKHFALHYMLAPWVQTGGVLVLVVVQLRRLAPALSAVALSLVASSLCVVMGGVTLVDARTAALRQSGLNAIGGRLSKAVVAAGPACANVSGMFVRAPENDMNHGWDMTLQLWGDRAMRERFSAAYASAFTAPLLDHNTYTHVLKNNFRPYSYAKLALDYPCIIVRSAVELDAENAIGLLALKPDHCEIEGIHVYSVGLACAKVQSSFLDAR